MAGRKIQQRAKTLKAEAAVKSFGSLVERVEVKSNASSRTGFLFRGGRKALRRDPFGADPAQPKNVGYRASANARLR